MSNALVVLALTASLGQQPYPYSGGGESWQGGQIAYPEVTPGAYGEPLYNYDTQEPWVHGYFQQMPSYRGHAAFRPYNYKHVLSQSQTAAGWGLTPTQAYSQQFWHRYHDSASLNLTQTPQGSGLPYVQGAPAQPVPAGTSAGRYRQVGFGNPQR